ncbi:MAG: hypothetical protein K2X74_15475, partial [Acetobacteraceae bacterium]|nr:hypothetical protein [Acetobacteraceae bacterium]
MTPIGEIMARLQARGGEAVRANLAPFARDLEALLRLPPRAVPDPVAYRAALVHGFAYYYWAWDSRATELLPALATAMRNWAEARRPDLDMLCELTDFLYFTCWCFGQSSTEQSRRYVPALAPAVA